MAAAERIRYLEEVQDLYLALRGSGLCLSPLDVDLVGGWWAEGVPLSIALDAVREAAARHRGSGRAAARRPFPLRLAGALVEERFNAYVRRSGAVARPEVVAAPVAEARGRGGLEEALRARADAGSGPAAASYRAATEALVAASAAGARPDLALAAADDAQSLAYLAALPRALQHAVASAAVRDAGPRGHVPRAAHRATLRVHLGEAARRHGNLDRPSDLA